MTFFISGQKPEPREANVGDVEARAEQVPRARGRTGSRGRPAGGPGSQPDLAHRDLGARQTQDTARSRPRVHGARTVLGRDESPTPTGVALCSSPVIHSLIHSIRKRKDATSPPTPRCARARLRGAVRRHTQARVPHGRARGANAPTGNHEAVATAQPSLEPAAAGAESGARPAAAATSPQPPGLSGDLALRGGGRLAGNRGGSCHSAVSGRAARLAPLRLSGPA